MGASTIANRPLQDFQAKVGGGQLFDMGGSTVKYGTIILKRCLIYEIGVLYMKKVYYSIKEVSYIRNRCPLKGVYNYTKYVSYI